MLGIYNTGEYDQFTVNLVETCSCPPPTGLAHPATVLWDLPNSHTLSPPPAPETGLGDLVITPLEDLSCMILTGVEVEPPCEDPP